VLLGILSGCKMPLDWKPEEKTGNTKIKVRYLLTALYINTTIIATSFGKAKCLLKDLILILLKSYSLILPE
jgi:hypothetical protein